MCEGEAEAGDAPDVGKRVWTGDAVAADDVEGEGADADAGVAFGVFVCASVRLVARGHRPHVGGAVVDEVWASRVYDDGYDVAAGRRGLVEWGVNV